MGSNVYIKNIPMDYLKNKSESFFESDSFKSMVTLFDSKKKPVEDTLESSVSSLDKIVLPIETLKKVLIAKYNSLDFEYSTSEEQEDYIFIGLSGKNATGYTLTPRRLITRTSSQISSDIEYMMTSLTGDIFSAMNTSAKQSALEKVKAGDMSEIKGLLKPDKSGNVVLDIVRDAKFFEKILSNKVYDNTAYLAYTLRSLLRTKINMSGSVLPLSNMRKNFEEGYPAVNRDIALMLDNLKFNIISKYLLHSSDNIKGNYPTGKGLETYSKKFNPKAISAILSSRRKYYPLMVFKEFIVNSDTTVLTLENPVSSYRLNIFDEKGNLVDNNSLVLSKDINGNELTLKLNRMFTGTVLLLVDVNSPSKVHQNFKYYFRDLGGDKFVGMKYQYNTNRNITIPISGYNNGYFFIELYEFGTDNRVIPKSISCDKDNVYIGLTEDSETNLDIIILPTSKILGNISYIKISKENIYKFLEVTNVIDPQIKVWSI